MKVINQQKLDVNMEEVQKGIQGILDSPKIFKINWWEHIFESDILLELKKIHNDSIDCMLFYLAIVNCEIFATFDDTLIDKNKESEFIKNFVQDVNTNFKVWQNNLSKDYKLFLE